MSFKDSVLAYLDANRERFAELAHKIWANPELGLEESYAADLLADELEEAGFDVERGLAQMPTAFVASWGEGEPTIGLLGEYDALPGLSQQVSATREPVEEGAPGHGCGHNLLGVGSLAAALAVKEVMEQQALEGTIQYYGCPAEETMIGKIFMAKAGVFDDLDAAITWHPFYANTTWWCSFLAMNSFKVNFRGVAAHAAAAPHEGRSALDGAQLMDVGVNYLREHVIQEARIHCVITEGGEAPNVVPPFAQIWYYVRAPLRKQVEQIYDRMLDIAEGAALMSGTEHEIEFVTGSYNMVPNDTLSEVLLEKLKEVGPPEFNEEEIHLAKHLQETFSPDAVEDTLASYGLTREEVGDPLCDRIVEPFDRGTVLPGSTDVGDVSHIAPTAQITTCCQALGTPLHSWQNTASVGSSIGTKGMMLAAKAMALAALDLETQPDILEAAQDEFAKKTGGKEYTSPLPEDAVPG